MSVSITGCQYKNDQYFCFSSKYSMYFTLRILLLLDLDISEELWYLWLVALENEGSVLEVVVQVHSCFGGGPRLSNVPSTENKEYFLQCIYLVFVAYTPTYHGALFLSSVD